MSYTPPGVDRYSPLLEVFVIEDVMRRLSAGIKFTIQDDKKVWCAKCIHEHGQPDAELVDKAESLDVAARDDDPMTGETHVIASPPDKFEETTCSKCNTEIPMVNAGDRALTDEQVRSELGIRSRSRNESQDLDVNELAEDFKDRFDV